MGVGGEGGIWLMLGQQSMASVPLECLVDKLSFED